MQKNNHQLNFDLWHARHVARQLENRSGEFVRTSGSRPVSWGECQDLNASRLTVLLRSSHIKRNPEWECAAVKNRLQLDRRGKREKSPWYDTEYRLSFQINNRAFEPKPDAPNALWESRATYEAQECNLRSRLFKNAGRQRVVNSWHEAQSRVVVSLQRPRPLLEDFQGREHNSWDLAYRHARIKFSHAPPIEDSWYRSVKAKLQRLFESHSREEAEASRATQNAATEARL